MSIGLGSAGGITGNASFNSSRGSANGTDTTYTETVIQSGNVSTGSGQSGSDGTVTLQSGADTNSIDSEVIGNQVITNVRFPLPNPLPAGVALMECNEIKG